VQRAACRVQCSAEQSAGWERFAGHVCWTDCWGESPSSCVEESPLRIDLPSLFPSQGDPQGRFSQGHPLLALCSADGSRGGTELWAITSAPPPVCLSQGRATRNP
jgi:hypothetical protein